MCCEQKNKVYGHNTLHDRSVSVQTEKKMQPYLFLLATNTHTKRMATMATITTMITSQSAGRREIAVLKLT